MCHIKEMKGFLTKVREKFHKIIYHNKLDFLREQSDFRQNSYRLSFRGSDSDEKSISHLKLIMIYNSK